jgi:hypothetical protein
VFDDPNHLSMSDGCARKIVDLSEVTLVDIAVVRFLITCEDEGIELVHCPPYVRAWILRERAEGAQPEPSNDSWVDHVQAYNRAGAPSAQ